jgi:hypothetical protein
MSGYQNFIICEEDATPLEESSQAQIAAAENGLKYPRRHANI